MTWYVTKFLFVIVCPFVTCWVGQQTCWHGYSQKKNNIALQLRSTNTPVMKPCHVEYVSNTRVGHTFLVYFYEFVTCWHVVPMLICLCNITWQCHTSFECDVGCLSYVDIVSCYHSNLFLTLQTFHQSFPYFSLSKVYVLQSDCTHTDVYFQKYLEVNPPHFNDLSLIHIWRCRRRG